MTTDTFILPRRANVEPDDSTLAPHHRPETATSTDHRSTARPRLTKRGAWGLLRSGLLHDSRRPGSDPLFLLGPSGGPIWSARIQ